MSSYFDEASLVMIPSGYKNQKVYSVKPLDGSGDLTFSRASSATRVASNGLIEKVRTNLLLQSNTFTSGSWVKDGCTITANYGIAPDGTQTASRAVFSGGDKTLYQLISATGVAGSLYVKGTAGQTIAFGIAGSESTFTLDGTWQRFTKSIAGATTSIQLNTYGGVTARDVLIWSAQLEYGDIATDPIVTTSAAVSVGPVSGLPRLDYLNSSCPRLLLEPQRTNLATYSEQIDNAAWVKTNLSIVSNAVVSPDGYTNADKIQDSSTGQAIHLVASGGLAITGTTYTWSAFMKKGEYNYGHLHAYDKSGAIFDLNAGTVVSTDGVGATITNYGNGWYRCTYTFVALDAGVFVNPSKTSTSAYAYNGTTGSGIYVWGLQLEAGAYATSYIPTLGTSVTRVADAASKTGISSLIGQTEGTLFADINYNGNKDISGSIALRVYTGINEAYIFITNANNLQCELYNATLQCIITGAIGSNGRKKIAFAYKQNDFVVYMNGVQIGTDTSGTVGAMANVNVGSYDSPNYITLNGINQALLFKTRLTNAQLAELTTL